MTFFIFKGGGFFGEEDDETSMYLPGSSNLFRPDKDVRHNNFILNASNLFLSCLPWQGDNLELLLHHLPVLLSVTLSFGGLRQVTHVLTLTN